MVVPFSYSGALSLSPTKFLSKPSKIKPLDRLDQLIRRIDHDVELSNIVSDLRLRTIRQEILNTIGIIQNILVSQLQL